MNIPNYIQTKGPYYLHKKYGLSKATLHRWQKAKAFTLSTQIIFDWIKRVENKEIEPPPEIRQKIEENKKKYQ